MPLGCIDQTNGSTNVWGNGCEHYTNSPAACGREQQDGKDFDSNSMCCACAKTGKI